MTTHKVAPGDCISSLAARHGFSPDALWEHPDNARLKESRDDPNVLAIGDVVTIPTRDGKIADVEPGQRYRFQIDHTHVNLRVRLARGEDTMGYEPYVLTVGALELEGATDADGLLEERIPAAVAEGTLVLPQRGISYQLAVGHLEPITTWKGVAQRLRNLGLYGSLAEKEPTPRLRRSLRLFQRVAGVDPSGELDDATVDALRDRHGC